MGTIAYNRTPDSVFLNKKFGRLTVLKEIEKRKSERRVEAICECGKIKEFFLKPILRGDTKSCGCYSAELSGARKRTHGLTNHPLFPVWQAMRARCTKKTNNAYLYYGLVGVRVCKGWDNSFIKFYRWAIENGWKPGLTIDRHPNKRGHYKPSNCRIADDFQQARNKTNNREFEYKGVVKIEIEWAEEYGIPYQIFNNRLRRGWDFERALLQPLRKVTPHRLMPKK